MSEKLPDNNMNKMDANYLKSLQEASRASRLALLADKKELGTIATSGPEMFRVIKEFKPRWIIAENVRGIINIQDGVVFENVCADLESQGYEIQTFIIPAAGVGAPHRRDRVWNCGLLRTQWIIFHNAAPKHCDDKQQQHAREGHDPEISGSK